MKDTQSNIKELKHYKIIKSIAKGGMGEVFLAYDSKCKRHVALKKIRDEYKNNSIIKKRFLKEALIASDLIHPSLVPIYDIELIDPCFYIMPYIEGKTLKEILKQTRVDEIENNKTNELGSSIPALTRFFLSVCEAINYLHSKNILHRDIKPDNIIIGKYGEVLILDLGIAQALDVHEKEEIACDIFEDVNLTKPGKVTGTLAYLAPERVLGEKATISSDVYSLGSMLYQILTLNLPFKRKDIKSFKKNLKLEKLIDPQSIAFYRDIPKKLSDITKKCLSFYKKDRYKNVSELILDLKKYTEGKSEWILSKELDIYKKNQWAFEENVFLPKNIALTSNLDFTEWITLMISKDSFLGNVKINASFSLGKESKGIGFFTNVAKQKDLFKIEEGYRLWISTKNGGTIKLYLSNVLVHIEKCEIKPDTFHKIKIEKIDDKFIFYLDDKAILSHISHLPLRGAFVGFAYKDANFIVRDFNIYTSAYNVMVNCLNIADSYFTKEEYDYAIDEYRRIASSFPGRKESQEAIFRCAFTILEKAKSIKNKTKKNSYIDNAISEFEKLHYSYYEPFEYLGKSLAYKELEDFVEEAKCLELSIRKFENHKLIILLKEHIIYRMHESTLINKKTGFRFVIIALRFIENILENIDSKNLIFSLFSNIEKFSFFEKSKDIKDQLTIDLAYRLNKTYDLVDILETQELDNINFNNAIFSLFELNRSDLVKKFILDRQDLYEKRKDLKLINCVLNLNDNLEKNIFEILNLFSKKPTFKELNALFFALNIALDKENTKLILKVKDMLKKHLLTKDFVFNLDVILFSCYLLENNQKKIKSLISKYKLNKTLDETSKMHFLYGIYLHITKDKKIADSYFRNVLDISDLPSNALSSFYLISNNKSFTKDLLFFEKKTMYRHLVLYYRCLKNRQKEAYFNNLLNNLSK
ncbi:MAG: Serine/threonine-protein kinase PknD [Candidatus Anoxychlamydiales bacterium]|nr:Serine/threonine-protein kinase PknD [Candidatus Anoxychlamydiales bacterium]